MPEYTLAEAAAQLGLREEMLIPKLPGLGINLDARSTLTEAEFQQLAEEQRRIGVLSTQEGGEFRRSGAGDNTLNPGDVE